MRVWIEFNWLETVGGKFLDQLCLYQILQSDSALWSYSDSVKVV
jgi:hypothetical protein